MQTMRDSSLMVVMKKPVGNVSQEQETTLTGKTKADDDHYLYGCDLAEVVTTSEGSRGRQHPNWTHPKHS